MAKKTWEFKLDKKFHKVELIHHLWTNTSFNAVNGTTAVSTNVYAGSVALVSALGGNGGLDFQAPSGFTTQGSDTLHFALKASKPGQQFQVYIGTSSAQPLATPINLTTYGGQPTPDVYRTYNIPLSDLGASNTTITDIVILNPNSTDSPVLYVDDVKLSDGVPTNLTNSISEDWNTGVINTARWNNWGNPQTSVVSNQLRITSTLASGYYGIDSSANGRILDLTSSYVTDQLVSAGNQSLTHWEAFPLVVYNNSDTSYQLQFFVSNSTLYARYGTPSGTTLVNSTAYNSTNHKYFRIREASGTIYWDTSADGITWSNFTSVASPFNVKAVRVGMLGGTWGAEASTTNATFDNFNIVPVTAGSYTIKDDWASGSINSSVWSNWGGAQVAVVSNQLKITSTGTTGGAYYGLDSTPSGNLDFTNSTVTDTVINAGTQSTKFEAYPILITKADATTNQLLYMINNSTLYAKKRVSGTYTTVASATYNATNHKYLRIKEISGTVYWETSADGKNWISFGNIATPFVITGVKIGMQAGTNATLSTITSAIFDDFNIVPRILAIHVTDDWTSGTIDSRYWNNWGTPQTSVVSNQLKITSTLASGYYGLDSSSLSNPVDLTGSSVANQLVSAGNQAITNWEVFPVVIFNNADTRYALYFFVSSNNIVARYGTPSGTTNVATTTYNSTNHKYFRVRENKGTIYWDTSADGSTWTNFTYLANPFAITAVRVGMQAGTYAANGSTTNATFDNFNILP